MSEKELPAGWSCARLSDVLSEPLINGRSVRTLDGGFPVLRLTSIKDGSIDLSQSKEGAWSEEDARPFLVTQGDYLLSRGNGSRNLVGRGGLVGEIPDPVAFPDTMVRVRVDPKIMAPKYLRHLWDSPLIRQQIEFMARTTAGIYKVNQKMLEAIWFLLPPPAEQDRIVEALEGHLSRLDAAAATAQNCRKRLANLSKSILLAMVPEEVPDRWIAATVEQAGTVELGRARHPDWHHGPEMRPYLRVANVFEDRIDTSDVMEMDFSGIFEKYRLHPGDVLLNEGQSPHLVGRPALYRGTPPDVAFTNSLLRFKANSNVMPEWALMVFRRHLHARRFMREVRITTNIAHLSSKRLKAVEFPIPPMDAQKELVLRCDELLSGVDAMDREAVRTLKRADNLRRGILNRAFTGNLVPQDPTDEPASALLARIQAERAAQPKAKRVRRAPGTPCKAKTPAAAQTKSAPAPTAAPAHAVQQEFDL